MKRLFLSAVLDFGANVAHAYVDLKPVANHGSASTAHGVNRTGLFVRCNLMETGVSYWGYKFSNVIGTWDFAPYQTRVFTLPNNTNYYNFYCVPL